MRGSGSPPWNLPLLSTSHGCDDWEDKNGVPRINYLKTSKTIDLTLMSRRAYEIIGTAYECKMVKKRIKTWEKIFGAPYKEHDEEVILVPPEICKDMVKTKKCGEKIMKFKPTLNDEDLDCKYDPF